MQSRSPPDGSVPLFPAFEGALNEFLRAGGHTAKVIRSPSHLFRQYKAAFHGLPTYVGGACIEEAAQDHVQCVAPTSPATTSSGRNRSDAADFGP